MKTASIIQLVLPTREITPNKLHETLKLLKILPALYTQMQKAVIINTSYMPYS
jgi:hypothetical protein